MKPAERRFNDFVEGFEAETEVSGETYIDPKFKDDPQSILKGAQRTVAFTPFVGLFRQDKYLPIRFAPIQIELEVVGNSRDAVVGNNNSVPAANKYKSEDFVIEDVQFKCDLIELDNTLDNEYTQYLLGGKALPIHYTALTHASQVIPSINTTVNVSRGLTRLKAVFVSLLNENTSDGFEVRDFFHPMGEDSYDSTKEVEFQLSIGSKLYPEYPIRSLAEAFYQLRKSLGLHVGNEGMNIQAKYYRSDMFVIGIDLEKVLGSSFSGYNSKAGDLLTIKTKNASSGGELLPAVTGTTYKLFYALSYDSLMNIKLSGVDILE
jgi:hypothetical protein